MKHELTFLACLALGHVAFAKNDLAATLNDRTKDMDARPVMHDNTVPTPCADVPKYAGAFYATYQDVVDSVEVPGLRYEAGMWSMVMGSESIGVNDHGTVAKRNLGKLPYWGYRDENGMLMRIHSGRLWNVMEHGAICIYTLHSDARMVNDHMILIDGGYYDMLSQGPDAKIEKASEKRYKECMADRPDIYAAYKADPAKKGEGYRVRLTEQLMKYARIYNQR